MTTAAANAADYGRIETLIVAAADTSRVPGTDMVSASANNRSLGF